MTTATRHVLDRDLRHIQDDILRMGARIDAAIGLALRALAVQDLRLARQIVADDAAVNGLRYRVEEACLACIATQQPTASDLRLVVANIIIASELERMADYAAGIATTVLRMGNEPLALSLTDLHTMADVCCEMVRDALEAYLRRDPAAARAVAARDDVLDHLYNQIFHAILAHILAEPSASTRALYLLFSAHNLERIGDRVVNIAERVVFMSSGELRELNAGPDAPV